MPLSLRVLWNLDLADPAGSCALGDEIGQQLERLLFTLSFDRPPDRVSTRAARGESPTVPERALVSLERREDDTALVRLVPAFELISRHTASLGRSDLADIGRHPETGP